MSQNSYHDPPLVAVIVDEGSNPFELACACEIFGARRADELGYELYRFRIVTPHPRVVMRDAVFTLDAPGRLADLPAAHTVIVPNRPDVNTPTHPSVLEAVRTAHERGARMVGLCTGAYTLAEAGVLDGRAAAVHWQLAADFRRRFPHVDVQPDVLFVDDGDILTSAGSAAALDLGLHIVRQDHGARLANLVSRRLVFSSFRDGGQRQFVEQPLPETTRAPLSQTLAWARTHLAMPLTVADLARTAHLSPTSLHRRFRAELGTTPLGWLNSARVDLARQLLEEDAISLEQVAARSGLGTTATLRTQLRRHTGLSPTQYRARLRDSSGDVA